MTDFKKMVIKAINATIEQGEKSATGGGSCVYRCRNGLKCVVGHMIPDDKYKESFECIEVMDLHLYDVFGFELNCKEVLTLGSLQACHDDANTINFTASFKDKIVHKINNKELPSYCETWR